MPADDVEGACDMVQVISVPPRPRILPGFCGSNDLQVPYLGWCMGHVKTEARTKSLESINHRRNEEDLKSRSPADR